MNVVDAMNFMRHSWNDVTAETIANCFKKAGFIHGESTSRTNCENNEFTHKLIIKT